MNGGHGPDGPEPPEDRTPRIPAPRAAADNLEVLAGVAVPPPPPEVLSHDVLKSLLGAWALSACATDETKAVEDHLTECAPCAEEALRLRDAVGLLHTERSLDLDPLLRNRVLDGCLGRRPARVPVPGWTTPYDARRAPGRPAAGHRRLGVARTGAPQVVRRRGGDDPQNDPAASAT